MNDIFKRSTKSETFFKAFREFCGTSFKSGIFKYLFLTQIEGEVNFKFIRKVINSLFELSRHQLQKLNETYSQQLSQYSTLYMMNLNAGFEVFEILDISNGMMKGNQTLLTALKNDKNALQFVLMAFLLVRKFAQIKNNYLAECENILSDMFESLKPETEEDKKAFVSECVSTLLVYKDDPVSQDFLYEQILNIISPQKQRKEFLVQFLKQHTQEEFIKGNLSRNSYKSTDVGYTMADIRAKICKECDIGDPGPFELLVAGNLIDLDLPIHLVYEKVWVPFIKQKEEEGQSFGPEIPPMKVVIRISGLDGEATENRISNLVDDSEDEKTVEMRIRLTEVFQDEFAPLTDSSNKKGGFLILLEKLKEISHSAMHKPFLKKLVKLLMICSKNQKNRKLVNLIDFSSN